MTVGFVSTGDGRVEVAGSLSTWASSLRHNLTPRTVATNDCVIRVQMFGLRDGWHTDTYQNMLLTKLIDQFCGCGDITGTILQDKKQEGSDDQTSEFNNISADCWNIKLYL